MDKEKQRIKIAEACHFVEKHGKGELLWRVYGRLIYFDPVNDLNAMAAALNTLTDDQQPKFAAELVKILGWDRNKDNVFRIANATAQQLADAFCITLGIMEDEA